MKATGIVRRVEECVIIGQELSEFTKTSEYALFLIETNLHKT